jgi:hypothetical protein
MKIHNLSEVIRKKSYSSVFDILPNKEKMKIDDRDEEIL